MDAYNIIEHSRSLWNIGELSRTFKETLTRGIAYLACVINYSYKLKPSLFSSHSGSTPVSSVLAYVITHPLNSLVVTFSLSNKYLTILLQQETLSFLLSVYKLLAIIFSLFILILISPFRFFQISLFSCLRADSLNRNPPLPKIS